MYFLLHFNRWNNGASVSFNMNDFLWKYYYDSFKTFLQLRIGIDFINICSRERDEKLFTLHGIWQMANKFDNSESNWLWNDERQHLFAWQTKLVEIDPRWHFACDTLYQWFPNFFPDHLYLVVREAQYINLYRDWRTSSANLADDQWSAEQTLGITALYDNVKPFHPNFL